MRTPEELHTLKEGVETVSRKLYELTEEELAQVAGGKTHIPVFPTRSELVICPHCGLQFETSKHPATCSICGTVFYP